MENVYLLTFYVNYKMNVYEQKYVCLDFVEYKTYIVY